MDELLELANRYASHRRLQLGARLGVGMHGVVYEATTEDLGEVAVKLHRREIPYDRERGVYQRLAELGVLRICGCNVPHALHFEPGFLAIEMTIVQPPYLLDFGGAWLDDEAPKFPPNVIAEWKEQKREQFEDDWPLVERILRELRLMGIHLLDIHTSNIDLRGHPDRTG